METESESSVNVSGGDAAGDNEASEAVTELNIDPEPDIEVPWKLCTNQHLTTTVKHARAPDGKKRISFRTESEII